MRNPTTWHLDDYRCSAEVRDSFQETAPRKTTNTVRHCNGGVRLMVANHRHDGGESLVGVTTLQNSSIIISNILSKFTK